MEGPERFNTEERLAQVIETLHKDTINPILINNQIREFFKTMIGIRQGCFLSPGLFKTFLKKIIQETLHNHHCSLSISAGPSPTFVLLMTFVLRLAAMTNLVLAIDWFNCRDLLLQHRGQHREEQKSWSTAQTTSVQTSS